MRVFLFEDIEGLGRAGEELAVTARHGRELVDADRAGEIGTCGPTRLREQFQQRLAQKSAPAPRKVREVAAERPTE